MLWKCCTQYASKFGNSAVATGLEKFTFHSNPKEGQCQRMFQLPHNCIHLTCLQSNVQNSLSQASTGHEELLHLCCKEYNQSDFSIDHLVMSICRVFSCVVGRGCLLRPVRSLGKTLLTFALLHFVLQDQICLLLQVSLDFLLLHSSPL